jgi:hypothetical protein
MSGLSSDDILRMVREVADKDKVDPVHNDMVTLTVDELGKLLAAEREACAKICEEPWQGHPYDIAKQIRARGSDAA